jgi:AbrB family looped-hinge helix DNA binding protein
MSEATVTSKGQVTIPAEIRKALGLSAGERVIFTRLEDGTTVMRAKTRSILDLAGLLKPAIGERKVSIDDMNLGRD